MADDAVMYGVADFLANPEKPVGPSLKSSLMYGVQQAPDVQAQTRAYARKLGVPLSAALSDPAYVKQQGQVQDLDPNGMVLRSPKTANWMAEPDNAAVAHDDVNILANIEQVVKNLGGIAKGSAYTLGAATYSAAQAVNEFIDPFGDLGLATRRQLDPKTGKFTELNTGSAGAMAINANRKSMEATAQASMPTTENWMQAGVNSGVASLLQNAPGVVAALVTKNPELGLALMGGQTAASAYGEARDTGLSPGAAAIHAGEQGSIEVLTEKLPMEALLKDLKAGSGVVKTWLHQVAKDVPGEITATMMQDYNDWADLHPDKPFMDYVNSRPEALGETVIATLMGVSGHTALEQVAHAAGGHAQAQAPQVAQAQQAAETHQMLDNMVKASTASALRERDPQTFKEYVDAVTQDTPAEKVYINAQDLVDVLGQGSPEKVAENAQVLEAMPSVAPQLEEALKSGGLVEIPTSELMAFTPDTALGQAMMEHLKVDPEAMSMAEGQHFMQTQGETFKAEVAKAVETQGVADTFAKSADAVRENIATQLHAANRFTGDVNEAYASMVGSFYATQAARLNVTPEQLYEQHPLTIKAQGVMGDSFTEKLAQGANPAQAMERAAETPGVQLKVMPLNETDAREMGAPASRPEGAPAVYLDSISRDANAEKGAGAEALQRLVASADQHGAAIHVSAMDTGSGKLKALYRSVGFADAGGDRMVREPQARDLEQTDAAAARGTFSPATNTIVLLKNADLSTFLHELGHFYLETLARMAADPAAPEAIREDWAVAADFLGAEADPAAWLAKPVDERRDGHETWARGFEAYLREGKAPSPTLKGVFQRFKSWLMHVYQNLQQLGVELTPEVRSVMDRLLATDEEIAQAQNARHSAPVLETKPDGMSDLEWEAYQRLGSEATSDAQDELAGRSIRDMRWLSNTKARMVRELTKEAREKKAAIRAEVEAEVHAEPVYAAQQFLRRAIRNGETFEGPHKLSIADVEKMYSELPKDLQDWRKLGYGKYGMLAEDGLNPDHVAEWFGFTSGDELVEALLNAEPMRAKIDGMTDQRMLERYGDLTDAQSIAKAADEAIHNDARLRFVATEANALAKAAGKTRIMAEAARDFARELIGRQRIRDVRPGKYTGAETRAAREAAQAHAKGDLVAAATQKRNQLINGYAAKAAYQAQKDVEAALRYFARLDGAGARKAMDPGYRDQIDQLLERFDLRKGESLKAIDKRKSLAAWIKSQEDQGLTPVIDEDLANEAFRKHYRDMTVDEMRGLVDAVRNIAHLGRLKNKLLVAAKGRAFQAVVDESEAAIRDNAYQTRPDKIPDNTWSEKALSGLRSFVAQHRKLASLIREMGGINNDGGILWRAFIEPMNAANDKEAAMREQATEALQAIYKPIIEAGGLRTKMFIREMGKSLTLENRLAVALNWGNELNRARIMDGEKITAEQATAVLSTLTAEQLEFVNRVHEYLDSFWPDIAAKERRVTGVEPEKVEPEPYQLHSSDGQLVDMRGGYYPIKYDTGRSSRSEADDLAEALRSTMQGAYTRATTRRGHTKARVDKVERPVRYDLSVPFQHVNQVIHDLSFHEYLIDANRLLGHPQIEAAIRDHYGPEVLRTMRKTLEDIAVGDSVAENALDRVMNYIRTGSSVVGLGLNVMTAVQQPLGLTQSIVRVGPKYMARGIGMAFHDAASLESSMGFIAGKSDFMRLRAKTMNREVAEVQNKLASGIAPDLAEKMLGDKAGAAKATMDTVQGSFFALITKLQLVADVPTWLGAYVKAQDQGHDDATAVHLADQAVRDSQGSGQTGDLAQIQRGSAWFKLWTNFYSFFSIGYNQMAESLGETRRVGPSRLPYLASDFLLVAILPSILGELLKKALRGDDWDWEQLGPQLAKAQVSFLLGFMVGARELGGIIQNDGKSPGGPASLRLLTSDLPKLYQQAQQGEMDDALRKAALNSAGILLHFPAAQINRTIDGFEALAKGETKNPMALAFGPPRKSS